jgi:hypothetical protein
LKSAGHNLINAAEMQYFRNFGCLPSASPTDLSTEIGDKWAPPPQILVGPGAGPCPTLR